MKHIVILLSVVIFFILVSACRRDYSEVDRSTLSLFEEKVCLNKSSIMSAIAMLFIFTVISGVVKKKLNKNKNK
jgi:hypothetical protein